MCKRTRHLRFACLSAVALLLGAAAGSLVSPDSLYARDDPPPECWNQHYCEGGSDGRCEPTLSYRWCEYSPSGICMHWYGGCPYN